MIIKQEDITIRMAQSSDVVALAILTAASFEPYKPQWQNATNDWMVAEINGIVHGCLQLCIGRPTGRLAMLCLDTTLDNRSRHAIMVELVRGGMFALQQMGSQVVTIFVDYEHKGFKRLVKKRFEARVTNSGNLLTTYLGGDI